MKKFIVTLYEDIGSMEIKAETELEAIRKVDDSLVDYFNHGYSRNIQLRAREIREQKIEEMDEQELNDKFVRMVHGVRRADKLQWIWNTSYPHYNKTKEQEFREQAKEEGFTNREIKFFLILS